MQAGGGPATIPHLEPGQPVGVHPGRAKRITGAKSKRSSQGEFPVAMDAALREVHREGEYSRDEGTYRRAGQNHWTEWVNDKAAPTSTPWPPRWKTSDWWCKVVGRAGDLGVHSAGRRRWHWRRDVHVRCMVRMKVAISEASESLREHYPVPSGGWKLAAEQSQRGKDPTPMLASTSRGRNAEDASPVRTPIPAFAGSHPEDRPFGSPG